MACFSQHFQAKAVKGRQEVVHICDVSEESVHSVAWVQSAHFWVSCHYWLLRDIYSARSLGMGRGAGNGVSYAWSALFYEDYLPR